METAVYRIAGLGVQMASENIKSSPDRILDETYRRLGRLLMVLYGRTLSRRPARREYEVERRGHAIFVRVESADGEPAVVISTCLVQSGCLVDANLELLRRSGQVVLGVFCTANGNIWFRYCLIVGAKLAARELQLAIDCVLSTAMNGSLDSRAYDRGDAHGLCRGAARRVASLDVVAWTRQIGTRKRRLPKAASKLSRLEQPGVVREVANSNRLVARALPPGGLLWPTTSVRSSGIR